MDNSKDHQLILRVMRLTKPSIVSFTPIHSEPWDLTADPSESVQPPTSEFLMLPQSFGSIFLGETFVCYLSVNNDSSTDATNITLTADLQTSSQRITLSNKGTTDMLSPGKSVDQVISHEVKELGTHILVCIVTYKHFDGVFKSFRKFFKFQVLKPLDVKTKFYNVGCDKLFLETQIQNITQSPICIEKIDVEPSPMYCSKSLNPIYSNQESFSSSSYLNPYDTRQYLYMLQLNPDQYKMALSDKVSGIGKLDIVWKSSLGERGRLQTSQLQRAALPQQDLTIRPVNTTSECVEMQPFDIKCVLTNLSDRTKQLQVDFDKNQTSIMWLGISGFTEGKLPPKEAREVNLSLLPVCPGLKSVSGLVVTDLELNRTSNYNDIHELLVTPAPC